jgi:hypothetical protein
MDRVYTTHEVALDELTSPACREFLAYWSAKRQADGAPLRKDFDPLIEKPHLVPSMAIYEVVDGGRDFRARLIGTRIVEIYAADMTGRLFSDLWARDDGGLALDILRRCTRNAEPIAAEGSYYWRGQEFVRWSALNAPVRLLGPAVEQLMVLVDYLVTDPVIARMARVR